MPLYLKAEQKNLKSLFSNDDKYVVPEYQRSYSWGEEEINQLYKDLTESFNDGNDYFLGNIILARSDKEPEAPRVIDGQQRIISLWIMIRVLSLLMPSVGRLVEMYALRSWTNNQLAPKIDSSIIESQDSEVIQDLFSIDEPHLKEMAERTDRLSMHPILYAATLFYEYFTEYFSRIDDEVKTRLFNYLISSVYLLPIELSGNTNEDAVSRALTIFETLNNRGLNLCDADIFKARLYRMAEKAGNKNEFREQWGELVRGAEEAGVSLDDIFRYYSRILRGSKSIVKSERKLRDFYLNDPISPFNGSKWQEITEGLNRIVDVLRQINDYKEEKTDVGILCRILDSYSNSYPWSAVVAYLYNYQETKSEGQFVDFLNTLVRICYIEGSTTEVRLKIFDLTARVLNGRPYTDIQKKAFDPSLVINPKGLRKGLTLLYNYLEDPSVARYPHLGLVRLYKSSGVNSETGVPKQIYSSLANCTIKDLETQKKRYHSLSEFCQSSPFSRVQALSKLVIKPAYSWIMNRRKRIEVVLSDFFDSKWKVSE